MASGNHDPAVRPDVSAVVLALGTSDRLGDQLRDCLQSLGGQTVAPGALEIVVVGAAGAPALQDVCAAYTAAHPQPALRLFSAGGLSAAQALDIGLQAARGTHTLFVGQEDRVTPGTVEALLRHSRPDVVPLALLEDAAGGGGSGTTAVHGSLPDALRARAGATVDPAELAGVLRGRRIGVLVPTDAARTGRHRAELGEGAVAAFWLALFAQSPFTFRVVGRDDDAAYLRGRSGEADADSLEADVLPRLHLIRHLQLAHGDAEEVRVLADAVIAQEAGAIRDFLLRHPDRHPDVVAAVRETGVPEMPWPVVNRGRARDLALLYLFSPFLDTSALVAARRLRERGRVTDVVSQDVSNLRRTDPSSSKIAAEVLDEVRVLPGTRPVATWSSIVTYAEESLAEVADLEAAKGPYETVYSRAMSVESHFAAALLKLRSPGIRWVAEFSDPLHRNAHGQVRQGEVEPGWLLDELTEGLRRAGHGSLPSTRFFELCELVCYALADEVLFTNQQQLDVMLGYCADRGLAGRAAGMARASHHPVPTPDLYRLGHSGYSLDPAKVHIGYFGNFYVNRGLTEVTDAFRALSVAERSRVQLHVFTSRAEALTLETLEQGLADVITVRPLLGYLDYLNLTRRFDVLLIEDYATREHFDTNPYLPAKLADYLGSGVGIWAVCEPGSVLSRVEVRYRSELGDAGSATRVLRELAREGAVRSLA